MRSDVPLQRLDELVGFLGGGTPSRSTAAYYTGSIPWVTPKDMGDLDIVDAQEHITERALSDSAARIVPPGAVLVVVRSGVLKRRVPIGITRAPVAINQDMKALVCRDQLDGRYLARFLQSKESVILSWARGTTADAIPMERLRSLQVPVPTLLEQRRIAAILDKADVVLRSRQVVSDQMRLFEASAFEAMFGDAVANPRGWPVVRVGDVIESIDAGISVSGDGKRLRRGDEWAVLKISAVTSGRYRPTECKVVTTPPVDPIVPRRGDLLFSRANTRELVAATCLVDRDVPNVFLPDKLWRIRLHADRARVEYFRYLLAHPQFRQTLTRLATGTSGSMLNISQEKLKNLSIPLPPVDLQARFGSVVWQASDLQARTNEADDLTRQLAGSLASSAFVR